MAGKNIFDTIFGNPLTDIGLGVGAVGLLALTVGTGGAAAPADAAAIGAAASGGGEAAAVGSAGLAATDTSAAIGASAANTAATVTPAVAAAGETPLAVSVPAADLTTTPGALGVVPGASTPIPDNFPTALQAINRDFNVYNAISGPINKTVQQGKQDNQADVISSNNTNMQPFQSSPLQSLPTYNAIFGSSQSPQLSPSVYGPPPIQPFIASDRNLKTNIKKADRNIKDFLNKISRVG